MPGKIFINYRRDDSSGTAGRLEERLERAFGRQNLFMDVDHIPAGVDFVAYLNRQLAACDVFLAVIGPNWIDARDAAGRRRLDDPGDFVAVEIVAALARDIRVIPVMVDGARMPTADELPDALKPLVRRQSVELRNAHFGRDAEALIEKIRATPAAEKAARPRWPVVAAGAMTLLVAGWIGLYRIGVPVWTPWASNADTTRAPEREATRRTDGQAGCGPEGNTPRLAPQPLMPMAGALEADRWWKLAGNGGCRFVNGQLEIYTHDGSVLMAAGNTMIRRDFTYSMRAAVVSGSFQLGFGLVFGLQDLDNYFLFAKRNAGDYRLTQQRGGQEYVVLAWTRSDLVTDIRTPQRLHVLSEGPFVTLMVDDRRLQQVRIDREPWGSVGLLVESPGMTVDFSDVSFGPRG